MKEIKMGGMYWVHILAFSLVIVGALNWGLVGMFGFNLVESLGLPMEIVKWVYVLVGVAAVYKLMMHQMNCKACAEMMGGKKRR